MEPAKSDVSANHKLGDISPQQLWSQVLERLQLQLSRPTFETWIKTVSAEELTASYLIIRAPNPFARNWIQKYYITTIAQVVQDVLGQPIAIQITAGQGDRTLEGDADVSWSMSTGDGTPDPPSPHACKSELNPKYTFSCFVVGPNNRMAHAASLLSLIHI